MEFRGQHPLVNGIVHRIFDGIMHKKLKNLLGAIETKAGKGLQNL